MEQDAYRAPKECPETCRRLVAGSLLRALSLCREW